MYSHLRKQILRVTLAAVTSLCVAHRVEFVTQVNGGGHLIHCEASQTTDSESRRVSSKHDEQMPVVHVASKQRVMSTLQSFFPDICESDITRYLVARNWNLEQASTMLSKSLAWHKSNFPLSMRKVDDVLNQNCFHIHGQDHEGSPILYFRWGLYDSSKASPEQYMLTIGHLLEYVLQCSGASNVVVYVDLSIVEGGVNAYADMEMLRHIIQCASDNYPERLKQLILYPMPWYGMTVWKCLQIFVDQRSQQKLKFIPRDGNSSSLPKEIVDLINPDIIPKMFGGNFTGPLVDVRKTFTKL